MKNCIRHKHPAHPSVSDLPLPMIGWKEFTLDSLPCYSPDFYFLFKKNNSTLILPSHLWIVLSLLPSCDSYQITYLKHHPEISSPFSCILSLDFSVWKVFLILRHFPPLNSTPHLIKWMEEWKEITFVVLPQGAGTGEALHTHWLIYLSQNPWWEIKVREFNSLRKSSAIISYYGRVRIWTQEQSRSKTTAFSSILHASKTQTSLFCTLQVPYLYACIITDIFWWFKLFPNVTIYFTPSLSF